MGKHENSSDGMGVGSVVISGPSEASVSKPDIESELARLAAAAAEVALEDGAVYAVGESGGMYPIRTIPIPGTKLKWAHVDK